MNLDNRKIRSLKETTIMMSAWGSIHLIIGIVIYSSSQIFGLLFIGAGISTVGFGLGMIWLSDKVVVQSGENVKQEGQK